ncbi:LysR family transcriptional regulator [Specibacter sp. NPDC078709]|uniref:LysR family transcriptional regulator n=1 Tax=Specibacter sp. NPDC078709 TaxID=3154364 RepID=UPI00342235C8
MIELRVLEYFTAVADTGTVTGAAARCFVSQPAISRQLAALETQLGVKLFHRSHAGLQLNAAGRRYYPIATDILQRSNRAAKLMGSLGTGSLELVAACPSTTMEHLLAPFVARGGTPIADIRASTPEDLYHLLENDSVDFCISTAQPPSPYIGQRIARVAIMVQFPAKTARLINGGTVELGDLADERLIVPRAGSAIGRVLDEARDKADVPLVYDASVSSSTVAQALAAAGKGLAVVVEPPQFGLNTVFLQFEGRQLEIQLYAAWDAEHYAAPEIVALVGELAAWSGHRLAEISRAVP